ncbi:MAG: hypothetical protein JOS17DRAFT_736872 [Linnemannia elongata]|nr:MAG: hypothetical protein JOS17DRAFT_736872 [Linnemannia elongata]
MVTKISGLTLLGFSVTTFLLLWWVTVSGRWPRLRQRMRVKTSNEARARDPRTIPTIAPVDSIFVLVLSLLLLLLLLLLLPYC